MRKVGFGLRAAGDGEVLRHVAGAEAGKLGKDEPHPVAALAAGAKLREHLREDAGLGIHEALEVVRIGCRLGHGVSPQRVWRGVYEVDCISRGSNRRSFDSDWRKTRANLRSG